MLPNSPWERSLIMANKTSKMKILFCVIIYGVRSSVCALQLKPAKKELDRMFTECFVEANP